MGAARGFETVENRRKDRDETMKLEKLVGERFHERPADCAAESHALMLRGGYMKSVANGIYSSYTPLRRITQKIESILREEMDAIDGQEVLFDRSLENADRLVCGANAEDYHFSGLDMARDVPGAAYRDFAKIPEGGVCPRNMKRGTVEVSARDRSISEQIPLENAAARIRQLLGAMLAAVRSRAAAAEAE